MHIVNLNYKSTINNKEINQQCHIVCGLYCALNDMINIYLCVIFIYDILIGAKHVI